ncbi:MAG: Ig-like domain-containing protein, partial [Gemmatimonadetes bacterium]|nr:Ig-like domain-containing protein [Gemmatimonadota bacterium]
MNGVATFSDLAVTRTGTGYTLVAAASLSSTVSARATSDTFSVLAGSGSKLAFTVQPSNTQAAGTITPAVQVAVQDAAGNTVTTATDAVTLALGTNPGGGTLSGTTTVNAVNGVTTFTNLSISQAGTGYTLTASASGLTGTTSTAFDILGTGATTLAFTVQPSNTPAGAAITPAVQVAVQDVGGNTVTTATNAITLAIGANPGGGTLSGSTTVNAVSGVATFANLSIDKVGTGYTLAAAAGGLNGTISTAFNIAVGAASKLAFTVQPSNTQIAATITPAVQVVVQDAQGNTVTSATTEITLSIETNPGGGTLSGTTRVNAVNGVATFGNLSIDRAGNGYKLKAAAGEGLTDATSAAFDMVAIVATKLSFVAQPSSSQAGSAITPAVQVAIQDDANNVVPSATNAITLAIGTDAGGGTLSGTTTVNAVNGIATFSNLSINRTGTGYTLAAVAGGLTGATSAGFTITVGPTASVVVSPSGASVSGAGATQAFTALAKDAYGNENPNATFTWASLNPNVATINSSTGVATCVESGQVTISATVDGKTGYALLTCAVPGATPVNLWAPMTSGTAQDLYGVWGRSGSEVYTVGNFGTILHFNGANWGSMPNVPTANVLGIWGTSQSNLHASAGEQILHYDGVDWTVTASIPGIALYQAWGSAPDDVYVVGDAGVIRHFDGTSWSPVSSGTTQVIHDVLGFSSANAFATAFTLDRSGGSLLRFNGTVWSSIAGPAPAPYALWGPSADDLFLVGEGGAAWRFSGGSLTSVSSGTTQALRRVWGTSVNDVYAVGDAGTILRHNGTGWSPMTSGVETTLRALWGSSASDVFVVGASGTILRGYRGATVTVTPASPTLTALGATQQLTATAKDASNNTISGVTITWSSSNTGVATVNSSGLVTAVAEGTTTITATAPGGASGAATVRVAVPTTVVVTPAGTSVSGVGATQTFTAEVRDGLNQAIPGITPTWSSLNPSVATINSSTGVATAVASGQVTVSATVDGVTGYALLTVAVPGATPVNLWTAMTSGTSEQLWGVWGASDTDIFAVGGSGTILRYNGTSWS